MNEEPFDRREAHLVSLAASIAAGCVPCAGYYIERARQGGVPDDELRGAIAVAESIRVRAIEDCVTRARRRLGDPVEEPAPMPTPNDDASLFLSVAAAYAVNAYALVTQLFDRARAANVTSARLLEAIQIARGVRNMAIAIVDRRIRREGGPGDGEAEEPASCVCG